MEWPECKTFLNLTKIGSVKDLEKADESNLLLHHPIYPAAQPHNSM